MINNFPLNIPKNDFLQLFELLKSIFKIEINKDDLEKLTEAQYKLFLLKIMPFKEKINETTEKELIIKTSIKELLRKKLNEEQEKSILKYIK